MDLTGDLFSLLLTEILEINYHPFKKSTINLQKEHAYTETDRKPWGLYEMYLGYL